jgi:hypothetical protein
MYASIALIAMAGTWAANLPVTPTWESDYRLARQIGEKAQKPLAVFIGSGAAKWQQLTREGLYDAEIARLLTEQYVRVYVDVETPEGRKLAEAFGLVNSRGLIISDRTGDVQAFRHDGDLAAKDLARYLTRYCSSDHVVVTTETTIPPAAPVYQSAVYQASYQQPSLNGFGACRT